MNKPCKDDSCDGSHCRICGGHFLDFYTTERVHDYCEVFEKFEQEQKQRIKDHTNVNMFWYGEWGLVFFPDNWQPWEMSRLCQMFPSFELDINRKKANVFILNNA